jgi:hypothetical protein
VDPAPGFGGVLLGGIAARFAPELDEDSLPEIMSLTTEMEAGRRVPQPRLRHRFQQDRIGLQKCVHRLVDDGRGLRFELDEEKGTPAQHVLCAVYAAGAVHAQARPYVMDAVRTGLLWRGPTDDRFVGVLTGRVHVAALGDPVGWALHVLDLRTEPARPTRQRVQQAFRDGLRDVHPDHGGEVDQAAHHIARLTEARRILLGS